VFHDFFHTLTQGYITAQNLEETNAGSPLLHLQSGNDRNASADPIRVRDMFVAYFSRIILKMIEKIFCEPVKTMIIPFLNILI
jgi:hypothetical protein